MHRFLRRTLFAGTTAAAAALVAVTPAFAAASTITVSNPNADGSFTATTGEVHLLDTSTGIPFNCVGSPASKATGTILSGQYGVPNSFNEAVETLTFNGCSGPFGAGTAQANNLPYALTVQNYPGVQSDGTTPANGDGYIGPVNVHVINGPCEFDVIGDAPAFYLNATNPDNTSGGTAGQLVPDPGVAVANGGDVTLPDGHLRPVNLTPSCAGLVNSGDTLTYKARYDVDPPITISSP